MDKNKKQEEIKKEMPEEAGKKIEKEARTQKPTDEKDKKIQELTNDIKRVQADFENFAKRIEKEKKDFIKYSSSKIIIEILPIIDEFEIAVSRMQESNDKKGVTMILDRMQKTLEENGVRPMISKGCIFDPFKHEVICSQESNAEENTVLEEIQKGYIMNDKVIRFAKVKISKSAKNGLSEEAKK